MPGSHQRFRSVSTMELLGIMLRNRCLFITLHIVKPNMSTDGSRSGWCDQTLLATSARPNSYNPIKNVLSSLALCLITHVKHWHMQFAMEDLIG